MILIGTTWVRPSAVEAVITEHWAMADNPRWAVFVRLASQIDINHSRHNTEAEAEAAASDLARTIDAACAFQSPSRQKMRRDGRV